MSLSPRGFILGYAWLLHFFWAMLLLLSPVSMGASPLALLGAIAGNSPTCAATILLFSCLLALPALIFPRWHQVRMCYYPQQTLLLLSAVHSIVLAAEGHYADGVLRPSLFILADQLPNILAATVHTLALPTLSINES